MKFAEKIRIAAKQLTEFRAVDLSNAVAVRSYKERGAVRYSIRDFLRRGEMIRVGPGLYQYVGRNKRITLRQRLWDIARRMIQFNLDDLEQISQGNRETIKEFCSWMVREGYARRLKRGHFKVIGSLKPSVPEKSSSAER